MPRKPSSDVVQDQEVQDRGTTHDPSSTPPVLEDFTAPGVADSDPTGVPVPYLPGILRSDR